MRSNIIKTVAVAAVAASALIAPAAQAGGYRHYGFYTYNYAPVYYTHRRVYVPKYYVWKAPACSKYAVKWVHGYKKWVCVSTH